MKTIELTNIPTGKEYQAAIRQQGVDLASMLAGLNVAYAFRPHYVDLETGRHGVRNLIERILTEADCIMPAVSFPDKRGDMSEAQAEVRGEYLAHSLTAAEVIKRVRGAYAAGEVRYPDNTIDQYLTSQAHHKGSIESFRLFNKETPEAYGVGAKPRRYYLVKASK